MLYVRALVSLSKGAQQREKIDRLHNQSKALHLRSGCILDDISKPTDKLLGNGDLTFWSASRRNNALLSYD